MDPHGQSDQREYLDRLPGGTPQPHPSARQPSKKVVYALREMFPLKSEIGGNWMACEFLDSSKPSSKLACITLDHLSFPSSHFLSWWQCILMPSNQ
jgi:hypothetical protein